MLLIKILFDIDDSSNLILIFNFNLTLIFIYKLMPFGKLSYN